MKYSLIFYYYFVFNYIFTGLELRSNAHVMQYIIVYDMYILYPRNVNNNNNSII